jgi:hypothetical protein
LISRKTTRLIAEAYECAFQQDRRAGSSTYNTIDIDKLYDFLFDNEFSGFFCNEAKKTYQYHSTRNFKEFIMRLHTGETLARGTPDWNWEQRTALGQSYLHDLAEAIIKYKSTLEAGFHSQTIRAIDSCIVQLELEGYEYKNGTLLISEADVLDITEEVGTIENLYRELGLDNTETTFHHLSLSEEHYHNKKWDDSISNSRKFLECIIREVAATHSIRKKGAKLDSDIYSNQKSIRSYLEKEGLLEAKEREAITSVYGLLSETGGHPNMAESEEARLLRHLSLTLSQFVMLRLRGALAKAN